MLKSLIRAVLKYASLVLLIVIFVPLLALLVAIMWVQSTPNEHLDCVRNDQNLKTQTLNNLRFVVFEGDCGDETDNVIELLSVRTFWRLIKKNFDEVWFNEIDLQNTVFHIFKDLEFSNTDIIQPDFQNTEKLKMQKAITYYGGERFAFIHTQAPPFTVLCHRLGKTLMQIIPQEIRVSKTSNFEDYFGHCSYNIRYQDMYIYARANGVPLDKIYMTGIKLHDMVDQLRLR